MRYTYSPFLAVGIAFLVIGIVSRRVFLYLGIVFIVLALVQMRRRR